MNVLTQVLGDVAGSVNYNDLDLQMQSLAALKDFDFLHILPGHQQRMSFQDRAERDACIDSTIVAEKADPSPIGIFRRHADLFMGRPF